MAYPHAARVELPILQELIATGGVEDVRFLYARLAGYFPQLGSEEVQSDDEDGHRKEWRRLVQRAGRTLEDRREVERLRGHWTITTLGRRRVADEELRFSPAEAPAAEEPLTHGGVQAMLLEIGRVCGYHTQAEFEYYDAV